jgi:uncharacterized membrane protein
MDPEWKGVDPRIVVRVTALERGRRRIVLVLAFLTGLFGSLAAAAVMFMLSLDRPGSASRVDTVEARVISADRIVLRKDLRLVDEKGRELVFVGRDTFGAGEAVTVLGLSSPGREGEDPQQTVRLAASSTGAAVSIRTPADQSSASLFASESGPRVEVRDRGRTQVLSDIAMADVAPDATASADASRSRVRDGLGRLEARPAAVGAGPPPLVDLTRPESQDIGHGFLVSRLSLVTVGSGVRVRGRMSNVGSLDHGEARFEIEMAGRKAAFVVPGLASGQTAPFGVEIPGVPGSAAAEARIRYLSSIVNPTSPRRE